MLGLFVFSGGPLSSTSISASAPVSIDLGSTIDPPTTEGGILIAPGTRTGTLAWTEAPDTWQLTGTLAGSVRVGVLHWTEADDVWHLTGHVTQAPGERVGTLRWTEAPDTWRVDGHTTQPGGTIMPHPGLRSVTNATLLAAASPNSHPLVFVDIQWPTFSTKLCSYSTLDWAGNSWDGAGVSVALDDNGYAVQLNLNDASNALRTLAQTYGMRDRVVLVWLGYLEALAPGDPILLPTAYGDSVDYTVGKLQIRLGKSISNKTTTPRERVGPAVGINYLAPDGYSFHWGNALVTINSRPS